MNKEILYIDYDETLEVYRKMISASDGGFSGVRDEGGIRATLEFVRNDDYYPTFTDKLSYLVFTFCSRHYFTDGNKRIALTLEAYFLHKNERYWNACVFMKQFESIIYHIAASHISSDLLLRMMRAFMVGEDYDEALKLDIARATSLGELGVQGEDYDREESKE